jgi:PilZ domain
MGLASKLLDLSSESRSRTEMRSSVRFPLSLQVRLIASDKQYSAVTNNISANGVLMEFEDVEVLAPGTEVEFLIEIPEGILGAHQTAAVHCTGRIIRSYREDRKSFAAAVIDEYSFQ